jgi:hypothetical protein
MIVDLANGAMAKAMTKIVNVIAFEQQCCESNKIHADLSATVRRLRIHAARRS